MSDIRRTNSRELFEIVKIAAAHWKDVDEDYLYQWSAPLRLRCADRAFTLDDVREAIHDVRGARISAVPEISDPERRRAEEAEVLARRNARETAELDASERVTRTRSGGVIDISGRY